MANALKIMRGLPIPDANFIWGASSWTVSGFSASEYTMVGPGPAPTTSSDMSADPDGIGSAFALKLDSCPANISTPTFNIASQFTPYGVAAGPWSASGLTLAFQVVLSAKTWHVGDTNSNALVWAKITGYDEDGTSIASTAFNAGQSEGRFDSLTDSVGRAIYTANLSFTSAIADSIRYWKLILYFVKPTTMAAGAWIMLDFVGVGVPYSTSTYDALTTWYSASFAHGASAEVIGGGGYRPVKRMADPPARLQYCSLALPNMTSADKRIVQMAGHWQRPGNLSGSVPGTIGASTAAIQVEVNNHGTPSPALVVMDRDDTKRAFYATWPEPEFSQITGAYGNAPYWPDSAARWSTVLNMTEELC